MVKNRIPPMLQTTTLREIRGSLGRYLAILMIVALGVGFFAGLKVTKAQMIRTADEYLEAQHMFDFEIMSSLGYDEEAVEAMRAVPEVLAAEGVIEHDLLMTDAVGTEYVVKALSIPEEVCTMDLRAGRMPERADECLLDAGFGGEQMIGQTLQVAETNLYADEEQFACDAYTVVGIVTSPIYLNYERGTSGLGDGTVDCYIGLLPEGFEDPEVYTQIYLQIEQDEDYFTEEYDQALDAARDTLKEAAEQATADRKDRVLDSLGQEYQILSILSGISLEELAEQFGLGEGETYVLDNGTNTGYATFESNAGIVEGIAKVFPVFFFLVAAMVCMTTMTRMIDEQRTQIGVFKALGYSNGQVLGKYLFYSGSSALIGSVVGFLVGTKLFPAVIWHAYTMMYDFDPHVRYVMDVPLALISLAVALLCSMGATWASCFTDFTVVPAELIRPKAPKSGKRILLERVPVIWNRISFLYKVSIRNIFRYKKRFFMMVLGISGCTALLIAGFGIDSTVSDVSKYQFAEVEKYDFSVTFNQNMSSGAQDLFRRYSDGHYGQLRFLHQASVDVKAGKVTQSVYLVATEADGFGDYIDLHDGAKPLSYPERGEVIICRKLESQMDLHEGDTVTIEKDHKEAELRITGVCDNYVYNYIYVTPETYEDAFGEKSEIRTALVFATDSGDPAQIRKDAAHLSNFTSVAAVSVNVDMLERVDQMMESLNAVVLLVIFSAGLLAFIVLYNLTNINITERIREIATIKVLGFYPNETSAYVFRENLFLTAISAVVGIPLGTWLLRFVISQVNVDLIYFAPRITTMDYVWSVLLTFVFAFVVNLAMRWRLDKVSMTESLKSIE